MTRRPGERQGRHGRTNGRGGREKAGRMRKEEDKEREDKVIRLSDAARGSVADKVPSHTLPQADRENPADRWGDGRMQANQTEEGEGGQSEGR